MQTTDSILKTQQLSYQKKDKLILDKINIAIPNGKISALIGPNGSGKSTLLKLLVGLNHPTSGEVYLQNQPLSQYKRNEIAKKIAFLPQRSMIPDQFSVFDLLKAGRFPHQGIMQRLNQHDHKIINWALDVTEMSEYKDQYVSRLSGGLQQRAWLAMVLSQEAPLIVLDEPATYLDIKHQIQLLKLIKTLNQIHHKTILWVVHDLNHAFQISDYCFVLKEGNLILEGKTETLASNKKLSEAFEIDIKLTEQHGQKLLLFS
ncbi:MAG: ABC transporter ATP-binding protein [Gammaproteobacteria bacterium]|nr:MAG: ABC transporter ATP-binding protein [Gammaproteobacteria bacterium]UTW42755.1 ABC transporter ATP-binding protein [bacterium SCSIO 12844]